MYIQIALPEEIVHTLEFKWGNLERKLLEITVIEAYRDRSISIGKARELLGMETYWEIETFFQAKGIDLVYDENDLELDRQNHQQLREMKKL